MIGLTHCLRKLICWCCCYFIRLIFTRLMKLFIKSFLYIYIDHSSTFLRIILIRSTFTFSFSVTLSYHFMDGPIYISYLVFYSQTFLHFFTLVNSESLPLLFTTSVIPFVKLLKGSPICILMLYRFY